MLINDQHWTKAMNLPTPQPDSRAAESPHTTERPRCADSGGTLSHLFFSINDADIAESKAICTTCVVQQSCLDGAIERSEPHGVWGGQLIRDGVPIAVLPRRGRPRRAAIVPLRVGAGHDERNGVLVDVST